MSCNEDPPSWAPARLLSSEGCTRALPLPNVLRALLPKNTRIIIYTGHREMGLVLAGRYFLKKV